MVKDKYLSDIEVCKTLGGEYKEGYCIIPSYKLRHCADEMEASWRLRTHIAIKGTPDNVLIEPVFYYGYLQGFKVYINDKKYPKDGKFYPTDCWEEALVEALTEHESE